MSILGFGGAELALVTATMAAATVVQVITGVGLSLVLIPVLALAAPALVPAPALFAALGVMLTMVWGRLGLVDRGEIASGTAGLAIGTAAGVVALSFVDPAQLPRLFGALILIAAAMALAGLKFRLDLRTIFAVSLVSGLMGGLSGIHSPLIGIVYAGQPPDKVRVTMGLYWIVAYVLFVGMYALAGRFDFTDAGRSMLFVPGIAIGVWVATWIVGRVDTARMRAAMLTVAVASGVMLIARG